MGAEKIKFKKFRWLLFLAIIFFIIIIAFIALYFLFENKYQNKIYPNLWLGPFNLSGKTQKEAEVIINNKINSISQTGIIFYYSGAQTVIPATIVSTDSDFAYQIIDFEVEKTVNQALSYGRNNNFFSNFKNKLRSLISKQTINLVITTNNEEINKILTKNFSKLETPAKSAELIIDKNYNSTIKNEELGKIIDYAQALQKLKNNLTQLDDSSIQLFTKTDYPLIYKKDIFNVDTNVERILSLAPLTLQHDNKKWAIPKEKLASLLSLMINPQIKSQGIDKTNINKPDKIIIGLQQEGIELFLQDEIALTTDQKPINAKFEIKDGRVVEFQASSDGNKLNIEASFNKINDLVYKYGHTENYVPDKTENQDNSSPSEIELVTTTLKSVVNTSDANDLGIREIIGIGQSNFAGSPKNRRHNIKIGADSLNGLLIKNGEEFSLIKALGDIDAASGYLPELVIKGNKTIPEYGGGLCQIGTTIFRSALNTGLPITERRNHSYRVSYYEPAGTDATIYSPWPDFKFMNDTGNHILIQTRIEGDDIYFEFWGTRDNRVVKQTEPNIYNITKPGPTKYVETLDLPPGVKKCTESAHNGADASFDYEVTYPNGEIKKKTFNSHYIPWQAVCLIGVEKLSTDIETSTSTKEKTIDIDN